MLSGVTGGVAGGRDFIPLHFYTPPFDLNNPPNNENGVPLLYTVINDTAMSLEYLNSGNTVVVLYTAVVDDSDFHSYQLQLSNTKLYDSNISFNWLQEYRTNPITGDQWALHNMSLSLHHGQYCRMIFADSFDNTDESEQNWSFLHGSITMCTNLSCVLFNQGPNGTTVAQRYAQTRPLDVRVITYIDIPVAPTATLHDNTDCKLGQQLM